MLRITSFVIFDDRYIPRSGWISSYENVLSNTTTGNVFVLEQVMPSKFVQGKLRCMGQQSLYANYQDTFFSYEFYSNEEESQN